MKQAVARRSVALILVAVLGAGACEDSTDSQTGALEIYASYTCASQLACDPDGFVIALDDGPGQRMTAFIDTIPEVSVGQHTLTLSDVKASCTVSGANPQFVIVRPDTMVQAGWSGTCQ